MSRYIDADAFGWEMYHEAFETDTDMQRWDSGCWIRYKLFEKILEKQQPSDVRENVHGDWIHKDGIYGVVFCSECDYELHINNTNFCPNCGADMQKGVEE